jgi:hypothetical protein
MYAGGFIFKGKEGRVQSMKWRGVDYVEFNLLCDFMACP